MFSCEFCESSKNTFFYRTPPVAAYPNRGYLHCAILKALHAFQEKRDLKSRDMQFFLQNVSNEIFKIFKMFENNMKFTRGACWINSNISNRDKNTNSYSYFATTVGHYYGVIIESLLKSDSHHQKTTLFASMKAL